MTDSDDQFRAVSHLRVVYLTARPLRHLQETKRFIAGVSEREQLLPAGPLFCNKVHCVVNMVRLDVFICGFYVFTFTHCITSQHVIVGNRLANYKPFMERCLELPLSSRVNCCW
jgi:hypothetical protein